MADPTSAIRLETRFGAFDLDPGAIVRFPDGLPGYEECHEFVLVTAPVLSPLQCLHSVGTPSVSFLVANPALVSPGYRRDLTEAERQRLGVAEDTPLLWLSILTVDENGGTSANLRAPIVINPERMLGSQIIPQHSAYALRSVLPLAG